MILEDKELNELIESYEKKAEEAYLNYQETGHARYWNAYKKHEDMTDTLKVARDSKKCWEQAKRVLSDIKQWAGTISQFPYFANDRKEKEINNILNEIIDTAKWL